MDSLRGLLARFRAFLRGGRAEDDLAEELRFHLEMESALYERQGLDSTTARRAATIAFGGVERTKEAWRDTRGLPWLDRLARDIRYAARRLIRSPSFSLAAIGTLALGLGAAAAIFALVDGVILRPLPYPNADRLVMVGYTSPTGVTMASGQSEATYMHYLKNSRVFDALGIYFDRDLSLTDGETPERVVAAMPTPGIFTALGVRPELGSYCTDANIAAAHGDSAGMPIVISHDLWQRRYGGDRAIIGRRVEINRGSDYIAGVMPRSFHFPHAETQLWFCNPVDRANPGAGVYLTGIARLKVGVNPKKADADLRRLAGSLSEVNAKAAQALRTSAGGDATPAVRPLGDEVVRDVRPALVLLLSGAAFVLLVAWANVVNLFLVRGEHQRRQAAVERALGASRRDLARRFLGESMLLSLVGGVCALGVAALAVKLQFGFTPQQIPRLEEVRVDGILIALTLGLALVSGLLLGVITLARSTSGDAESLATLRASTRVTGDREWRRAQRALVVTQMALALALLIGSATMARSYWRMAHAPLGFDPRNVVFFETPLPYGGYDKYDKGARFYDAVLRQIRALPGVSSAEAGAQLLRSLESYGYWTLAIDGTLPGGGASRQAGVAIVTPGWFKGLGIPILRGRTFEPGDLLRESPAVVISASLAKTLFGTTDVLGKRVRFPQLKRLPWYTVVGIVGDVPGESVASGGGATIYVPVLRDFQATPDSAARTPYYPNELAVYVRASGGAASVLPSIRGIIHDADPHVPVSNVMTLDARVAASMARTRLTMVLLLTGALAALALGVVGIYGVVSYGVAQRTPELGIRIALGATPGEVVAMLLGQSAVTAAAGVFLGVIAAFGVTRLLRGLLYQVRPADPLTFVAVSVALLCVALLASYVPARRAGRIDPVRALRGE